MLAVVTVTQGVVIQVVPAQEQRGHTYSGVQQQAHGHEAVGQTRGHHPPRGVHAVDQSVENDAAGEDHPRLEAAPGTEIAVELDIEGEQQDGRNEDAGNDPKNDVVTHGRSLRLRPAPGSRSTPVPAVKITATSPRVS